MMDQEYKLRKDVDELLKSVAENTESIKLLNAIPYSRYGTVVKLLDKGLCIVKEEYTEKLHYNVVILNNLGLREGSTVVIDFANNSILNPYIVGELNPNAPISDLEQYSDDVIYDVDSKVSLLVSSPSYAPCVLNAYLTFNGTAYGNRKIDLYSRGFLLDSQMTDVNGVATFNVQPKQYTQYDVKYGSVRTVSVIRTVESIEETILLNDVSTDVVVYDRPNLVEVSNGKLITYEQFESFDYRRGKAYIKNGWNNSNTWTVSFTVVTGNHANGDGYVLIRPVPPSEDVNTSNQFHNTIGLRSNGDINVFDNEGVLTHITNPNNQGLNWNYQEIGFEITRTNNHYTIHMWNVLNPSTEYSYTFDWDGFNQFRSNMHLLLTVTSNYWGGAMELSSPTYEYTICKAVVDFELTASSTVLSQIDGDSTTLTVTLQSGQTLSLYDNDTGVKIGDLTDNGDDTYTYIYESSGAGDVTVYATNGVKTSNTLTLEDCYKTGIQSTDTWHDIKSTGTITVEDGVATGYNKMMDYSWDNTKDWEFSCEYKADTDLPNGLLLADVTNTSNYDYNSFTVLQHPNATILQIAGRTEGSAWGGVNTNVPSREYADVKIKNVGGTLYFYLNDVLYRSHDNVQGIENVCVGMYTWQGGTGSFKNIKIKQL